MGDETQKGHEEELSGLRGGLEARDRLVGELEEKLDRIRIVEECTGRREALEKEKEHLRARNARMVLKIRDGVSRLMDLSTELKERKEEFRLLKKPLSRGP